MLADREGVWNVGALDGGHGVRFCRLQDLPDARVLEDTECCLAGQKRDIEGRRGTYLERSAAQARLEVGDGEDYVCDWTVEVLPDELDEGVCRQVCRS